MKKSLKSHTMAIIHCISWDALVAQTVKSLTLQCRRPGFDPWAGKIPWRRAWQLTPVFLPGDSHGQRSLAGYSQWGRKESDSTERLHFTASLEKAFITLVISRVFFQEKQFLSVADEFWSHLCFLLSAWSVLAFCPSQPPIPDEKVLSFSSDPKLTNCYNPLLSRSSAP